MPADECATGLSSGDRDASEAGCKCVTGREFCLWSEDEEGDAVPAQGSEGRGKVFPASGNSRQSFQKVIRTNSRQYFEAIRGYSDWPPGGLHSEPVSRE